MAVLITPGTILATGTPADGSRPAHNAMGCNAIVPIGEPPLPMPPAVITPDIPPHIEPGTAPPMPAAIPEAIGPPKPADAAARASISSCRFS